MVETVVLDAKTLGLGVDISCLEKFGKLDIYETTQAYETVERAKKATIVVTNKVILDDAVLSRLPSLRLICVAATGVNNVDLKSAAKHGVTVCNAAGCSTESVVQHTFAMALHLMEKVRYFDDYCRNGEWIKSDIFCCADRSFNELYAKRWGIIGLGTIGRRVAQVAQAFGCDVVYASAQGAQRQESVTQVCMDELLGTCDIISIHSPLNEKTKSLIGDEQFEKMKKTAILLNLGRGGIVDEQAAANALKSGMVGAIGLDVLQSEPMDENSPLIPFLKDERLFITPHIAWSSLEARQRLLGIVERNIEGFLSNNPQNIVKI